MNGMVPGLHTMLEVKSRIAGVIRESGTPWLLVAGLL